MSRIIEPVEPSFDPGPARHVGLVSLASDEVCSDEIRRVLAQPGLAIHETRIMNADKIDAASLTAMADGLTEAARRLPGGVRYDAIGYLCTSASMLIGHAGVAERINRACPGAAVTNPMEAALAACRAAGFRRIGLVTPYIAEVTEGIAATFEREGIAVVQAASFFTDSDTRVARISTASMQAAARQVAPGADGVFLSCTALRTVGEIAAIEAALGLPVLSSNQVVAWRLAGLAGVASSPGAWGSLWQRTAAIA